MPWPSSPTPCLFQFLSSGVIDLYNEYYPYFSSTFKPGCLRQHYGEFQKIPMVRHKSSPVFNTGIQRIPHDVKPVSYSVICALRFITQEFAILNNNYYSYINYSYCSDCISIRSFGKRYRGTPTPGILRTRPLPSGTWMYLSYFPITDRYSRRRHWEIHDSLLVKSIAATLSRIVARVLWVTASGNLSLNNRTPLLIFGGQCLHCKVFA